MASVLSRKTPGSGRSLNADKIMPFKTPSEREPSPSSAPEDGPKDRFQLAYVIFFLHGLGHLLPWNFFITAQPYFKMKFTCPHGNHSEHCVGFNTTFESWFTVASMLPIFVMSAVNIWLQSKFHYRVRMVVSLLVMLVLFLLTTGLVAVPVSHWTDGFFALTVLSVFIMNTASSIFQSSTLGFAGVLPYKYTSAVMSGQAVGGVFAAVASILFSVISSSVSGGVSHKSIKDSAYAYFSVACLVIILCLISVYFLNRMPFMQFYFEKSSVQIVQQKQQKAMEPAVQNDLKVHPSYFAILKKVWWYAVSVYLVFTVSIGIFPALLSQIVSADPGHSAWTGDTYFPLLVCFLLFNVSDLIGRYITHWIQVGNHHVSLLVMCASRCIFIPAFLLCKEQVKNPLIPTYPDVPEYDIIPILLVWLFGLSNGYLGSTAMVTAPQRVSEDDKETASTIMAFFLAGGLLSGGTLSFLWTELASLSH